MLGAGEMWRCKSKIILVIGVWASLEKKILIFRKKCWGLVTICTLGEDINDSSNNYRVSKMSKNDVHVSTMYLSLCWTNHCHVRSVDSLFHPLQWVVCRSLVWKCWSVSHFRLHNGSAWNSSAPVLFLAWVFTLLKKLYIVLYSVK